MDAARTLAGQTVLITGASRGIGEAIGLRCARDGANVVVLGKTVEPHAKLPGTIYTAAAAMEAAGGQALAVACDVRSEAQIQAAVEAAVARFGRLDVVVNNASAIFLADTLSTPTARYDLMQAVNVRGTYLTTRHALPWLLASGRGRVLNIAPPLRLEPRWFAPHLAYSLAKYGMSLCVLGLAEELRGRGVGVNALWPKTVIATAAVQNLLGGEAAMRRARRPEIMADAAHAVLTRDGCTCTGNFFLDEQVLAEEGLSDLARYAVDPQAELLPDLFV